MNTADLLNRLEGEGVSVSLNLKLEADAQPSAETLNLIKENRDDLLKTLAFRQGLHIPAPMLESLLTWTRMYHELSIQHPDGLTLDATPEHVRDALAQHTWGVVYITDEGGRWLILSWGAVPTHALMELNDLETEKPIIADQVAA